MDIESRLFEIDSHYSRLESLCDQMDLSDVEFSELTRDLGRE
jgi:hypothetical protein